MSEASDSTNYLTTVSVERYNNRPGTSIHRSTTLEGNNHHRTSRYTPVMAQEELNRNNYSNSLTKSADSQGLYRSTKTKRSVEWDEENLHRNEGRFNIPFIRSLFLSRNIISTFFMAKKKIHCKLLFLPVDPLNYAVVPYNGNEKESSTLSLSLTSICDAFIKICSSLEY